MEALADQLNQLKAQLEDARVREKSARDRASEMEQVRAVHTDGPID